MSLPEGQIGGINSGRISRIRLLKSSPASMKTPTAIFTAILTASAALQAEAAVVCEFQPNLEMNDCDSCFKQDEYGLRLYLGGKLRASTTNPSRFPTSPIDGNIYQRGVEKERVSERNGLLKVFEVCYERSAPLVAGDMVLTMTENDFQEFALGNPGRGVGKQYKFALAGEASSGSASFFDNALVYMAPPGWKGTASIPYLVIDDAGRQSVPGVITVQSNQVQIQSTPVPIALAEPVTSPEDEELAAQKELNEALLDEIASLEALQGQAVAEGDEARAMVGVIESAIQHAVEQMSVLDAKIERLVAAKALREREALFMAGLTNYAPAIPSITFSINPALPIAGLPQRSDSEPPAIPVPQPQPWLIQALGPFFRARRLPALEPVRSDENDGDQDIYCGITAMGSRPSRRLSKKEKKRIKKVRRIAISWGVAGSPYSMVHRGKVLSAAMVW